MQIPESVNPAAATNLTSKTSSAYATRVSLIAALGGFLFGFETAVISGAELIIQKLWALESTMQGFTVASSLAGTVIGSIIASVPAQKYGRKKILIVIAILYLISAIGCALTYTWVLFVVFRFIGGIAVGASSVVGPTYISEVAPPKIRGRLGGFLSADDRYGHLCCLPDQFPFRRLWRLRMAVDAGYHGCSCIVVPDPAKVHPGKPSLAGAQLS